MICELCGRETGHFESILVDGAVLTVCPSCAKFGKKVKGMKVKVGAKSMVLAGNTEERDILDSDVILVENYAERIRNARMRLGLKQEDLAKKLMEKESVIAKIERGDMRPTDKLAKKLERLLNIKLFERIDELEKDEA